jgi:hypothetical protein
MPRRFLGSLICLGLILPLANFAHAAELPAGFATCDTWTQTLLAARAKLAEGSPPKRERAKAAEAAWSSVQEAFPVECDWAAQDSGGEFRSWLTGAGDRKLAGWIASALAELGADGADLRAQLDQLKKQKTPANDRRWLALYVKACEQRRALRLRALMSKAPRIVFVRHSPTNGSELCLLELNGPRGKFRRRAAPPRRLVGRAANSLFVDEITSHELPPV